MGGGQPDRTQGVDCLAQSLHLNSLFLVLLLGFLGLGVKDGLKLQHVLKSGGEAANEVQFVPDINFVLPLEVKYFLAIFAVPEGVGVG